MAFMLDFDALAEEVERRTSSRFSPPALFEEGVRLLIADVLDRGNLTVAGRRLLQRELLRVMTQRSLLDRTLATAPPPDARRQHDLVVVTGLPRTKSTLLHNLLAGTHAFEWVEHWRALEPFTADGGDDPGVRVERATSHLKVLAAMSPDLLRLHPMRADRPEECITLQQLTGRSDRFAFSLTVPRYREWAAQPAVAAQAYRDYLQLLEIVVPAGRPMVLKAPSHARDIDHLLALAPSAQVIWLTRPIDEVERSFARLVTASRAVFETQPDADGWQGAWRNLEAPAGALELSWVDVEGHARAVAGQHGAHWKDVVSFAGWLQPSS